MRVAGDQEMSEALRVSSDGCRVSSGVEGGMSRVTRDGWHVAGGGRRVTVDKAGVAGWHVAGDQEMSEE